MDKMMKAAGFTDSSKLKTKGDFADIVIISRDPSEFNGIAEVIKQRGYSCLNLPKHDIGFKQAELICYIYDTAEPVEYNTIRLVELIHKYKSRVIIFTPDGVTMNTYVGIYYTNNGAGIIGLEQMADMIDIRMRDEHSNADLMYDLFLMDGCSLEGAANLINSGRYDRATRNKLVAKYFG